jgi:hypothetical protein
MRLSQMLCATTGSHNDAICGSVRSIAWFCGEPQTYCKTNGKRRITNMSGDWIPVTERLPDIGTEVVTLWEGVPEFAIRERDGAWLARGSEARFTATHWMPLPAPPSDGKHPQNQCLCGSR